VAHAKWRGQACKLLCGLKQSQRGVAQSAPSSPDCWEGFDQLNAKGLLHNIMSLIMVMMFQKLGGDNNFGQVTPNTINKTEMQILGAFLLGYNENFHLNEGISRIYGYFCSLGCQH
jgi:hypothetical protein